MPKPGGCLMNTPRIFAFMAVIACVTVILASCSASDGNPEISDSGQGGSQTVTDKGCGDKPSACVSYDYNPDGKLAKVTQDGGCNGPGAGKGDDYCWTLTYTAEGKLATIVYDFGCVGGYPETYEFDSSGCPLAGSRTVFDDTSDWSYECDATGNVTAKKASMNGQPGNCLAYGYDDHGNGSKEEVSNNCDNTVDSWWHWSYTYGADGKVLTQEEVYSPPAPDDDVTYTECATYDYAADGTLLALHWYDECPKTKDYCYSYTKPPRGTCRILPAFSNLVLCQ